MDDTNINWPGFLDDIDVNADRAKDTFYRYVYLLLTTKPPRVMRGVSDDERIDLIHDIYVYCTDNDFAILRQYQDIGNPFAAWFYFVCHNRIVNYLKRKGKVIAFSDLSPDGSDNEKLDPINQIQDTGRCSPEVADLLRKTNSCIRKLDAYCQALLRLAGLENKPQEIANALSQPKSEAKKISDGIRYCRKKLGKLLEQYGLKAKEIREILSASPN